MCLKGENEWNFADILPRAFMCFSRCICCFEITVRMFMKKVKNCKL